jgi:hypothetical protein
MSDDEVVKAHDENVRGPDINAAYFLDELSRRKAERAERAAYELAKSSHEVATRAYQLARRTYWLAIAAAMFSALSAIAAIVGVGVAVGLAQS